MRARIGIGLILLGLLLAGCAPQVTSLAGVALEPAPVIPTPTMLPSPAAPVSSSGPPGAANHLDLDFLNVAIGFEYPPTWEAQRGVEYILAYDPAGQDYFPRVSAMVMRANDHEQADPLQVVARNVFLHWNKAESRWDVFTEFYPNYNRIVPETEELYPVAWGGRSAAVRRMDMVYRPDFARPEVMVSQFQVALRVAEAGSDYVTVVATVNEGGWPDFQPVLSWVLETLTVNGEHLPASQMLGLVAFSHQPSAKAKLVTGSL